MNHGSLFSGIGGFDLAAEWMGWNNVFHCEWNEFGRKVLNYHFPKSISYEDITTTDFNIHRGRIDILSGGFPCQPYSTAGKRLGKEDDRHLWPEMLRAIREIQPTYIVAENVLGLVSWNDGLVFDEVQTDLEAEGYEVQPYVLPAASIDAPHRRDRVWFIAHTTSQRHKQRLPIRKEKAYTTPRNTHEDVNRGITSNTTGSRRLQNNEQQQSGESKYACTSWEEWPTKPPICSGNDGISDRLDGITFPKWRSESIKAYGNAIVPGVAHQIFKAIEQYEETKRSRR